MKLIVISLVLVVLGLYYYSGRLRYRKRCLKVFARLDPILVSTEAKYARRFMPASLRHLLYVEPVNLGLLEGVRKASSEADLAALIARADELAACIEMLVNDA